MLFSICSRKHIDISGVLWYNVCVVWRCEGGLPQMSKQYAGYGKFGSHGSSGQSNSGQMIHICGEITKLSKNCPKPNKWLSGTIRSMDGGSYFVNGTGSIMLSVGDMVECDALETFDDKYGVQYIVGRRALIVPVASTKDEIMKYLAGPSFKGVGPVTAEKLYNTFGKWTIPTIASQNFSILGVRHGFRRDIIQALQDGMKDSSVFRRFSAVFPHLPGSAVTRILDQHEGFDFTSFVKQVNAHPYLTLHETYGVRIKDADSVALYDCHFPLDSDERLSFMVRMAVKSFCSSRHATYVRISDDTEWNSFFLYSFVGDVCGKMAEPMPDTFSQVHLRIWLSKYIKTWKKSGIVVVDGGKMRDGYPYGMEPRKDVSGNDEYALYTQDLYEAEQFLCATVRQLSQINQPDKLIKRFSYWYNDGVLSMPEDLQQNQLNHPLDSVQMDAVKMAWKYRLSFITGGPGRGKTSCLAAMIYAWLRMKNRHVILLAPTGKAIKRMQQQTEYSCASTIARFLMLNKSGKVRDGYLLDPLKNEVQKSPGVLIVVDEASMLCFTDAKELLDLVKDCTLVFVGDKDQLPPIEAGPFLQQCLRSNVTHVTELAVNYRNGACDWVENPERILDGGTMKDLKKTVDFMVIPASESIDANNALMIGGTKVSAAEKYIVQEYASCVQADDYSGVMLLTPFVSSKQLLSAARLNVLLQDVLNPKAALFNARRVQNPDDPYYGCNYYEGRGKETMLQDNNGVVIRTNDRIMNTKNFPDQPIVLFQNNSMEMADALDDAQMMSLLGYIPSGIYNGDVGTVRRVYQPHGRHSYQMLVELETDPIKVEHGIRGQTIVFSRFVLIEVGDDGKTFDNWSLAYALSIHKSQGCESPHVIITIPNSAVGLDGRNVALSMEPFITRNMFYTAVTRSSQTVTVVGELDALNEFMKHPYRYSNVRLTELLDGAVASA